MALLKRSYNVPLRREWLKVPRHKRAKKAMKALKQFLVRHMKGEPEQIRIGPYLNEHLWKDGMKNPPHHVKINTEKNEEGLVRAELEGKPMFELKKKEEKKEKSAIEQKIESVIGKKDSAKPSAKKEAKKKAAERKAGVSEPKVETEPEADKGASNDEKQATPVPEKPAAPTPANPAEEKPSTPKPEVKPSTPAPEPKPSTPAPEPVKPADDNPPKQ